ncbi:MAG: hypothetical protein JXB88_04745 [Spirochaetales bacterium]|nr:hypothetical protein [Spirochaetales bacterium]
MIVSLDKQTGDILINLPPQYENYEKDLKNALYDEFAFEPVNKSVLSRMNRFVAEWFEGKGVQLNPEETE